MANLVELFDNIVQMQALNGVPLANGKLYVYALGRTRLMDTWSDVDGESLNTNPIILDDAGQAHCFVSDDFDYTLVVKDAYDNEIFSIDKYLYSKGEHSHADVAVAPSEHIGVSSYHVGETTVYVPYIQGELGKTYHGIEPIVVNNQENKISARNIPLGVQSPLYFAEDSESACIIAMSGEYQPVTGMSGYATTGDLVDLATSVSETYQPKGDYATHDDLSGFMEESKLETADGKITGYDGTAFAGGGSVDPSEFIPWSASGNFATSGDLNDKLDTTAFSTVSGDFITAVPDTYATKDFVLSSVSSKLDSTAFADVSGDFITALPEGLLNESGFEYDGDKISAYNGSAFVGQGGGITGEYELSAGNGISIDNFPIEQKTVISVSGDYITKNSADTLYYGIDNPSGFITGVDLSDYQTTAGMTAYQPAGDYLTTGDSANFYTTANESGYLTAVPDTYLQNTDLTITDGKITEISGVPLSAGDELPSGVMNTSALEYNAVNEISGYNGSAIAQYGAEKQWLVHDDTLVHAANSAQYALGCNISALQRLMGIDETVLFTGSDTNLVTSFNTNEPITNFNSIKAYSMIYTDNEYIGSVIEYDVNSLVKTNEMNVGFGYVIDNGWKCWGAQKWHITNNSAFEMYRAGRTFVGPGSTAFGFNDQVEPSNGWVYKVIGIGRKQ